VSDFLGWEKVPVDIRSSFTSDALEELSALPDDWPEIEYISGAGYVGNWTSLLFGRNVLYPSLYHPTHNL
jgi:choline dehydrogenase